LKLPKAGREEGIPEVGQHRMAATPPIITFLLDKFNDSAISPEIVRDVLSFPLLTHLCGQIDARTSVLDRNRF
jgi:hypothetical protein